MVATLRSTIAAADEGGCGAIAIAVFECVPNGVGVRASFGSYYLPEIGTNALGDPEWSKRVDLTPIRFVHATMAHLLNCPATNFSIAPFYCLKTCVAERRAVCASSCVASYYPKYA